MEDQQPATGDLTGETGNESDSDVAADSDSDVVAGTVTSLAESATTVIDENDSTTGESAVGDAVIADETDPVSDGEADEAVAAETVTEGTAVLRKPIRRGLVAAVIAAALLFVGSAAFAGAAVRPYLTDQANAAIKFDVARTAAKTITTLWSYTPDNLDQLPDRAAHFLSGDLEAQYRKFVDAIAAPNKQAQVTNDTQVTGAAVESLAGSQAIAIVYTNTTSTSPLTKNIPSLKYLSYRLNLSRDHARWLVTRMTTVTSLDLTPRL